MAESEAAVCNLALGRVQHTQFIDDLTTDDSNEAEQCRVYYSGARDETLERAPWPFATRRKRLVPFSGDEWAATTPYATGDKVTYLNVVYRSLADANTGNQPDESPDSWVMLNDPRWLYAYPVPSDCIAVRRVGLLDGRNPSPTQPFDIKGDFDATEQTALILVTDDDAADVEYTARVTNPAAFSASFASAVAWRLASDLAVSLKKDPELALKYFTAWEAALAKAVSSALGSLQPGRPLPPHIAARF